MAASSSAQAVREEPYSAFTCRWRMDMTKQDTAWVIDDDQSIRWVLEKALQKAGIVVRSFDAATNVLDALKHAQPDVVLSDIRMPGGSGLELLEAIGSQVPDVPVIIMTAHSDLESAVASYRGGAFEYLPKPFDMDEAVRLARRAIEHRRRQKPDTGTLPEQVPEIGGEAPAMQEGFRR